jgi:hypothetical protein
MTKWEYAAFDWEGGGMGKKRYVRYSHRPPWDGIGGNQLMEVFRTLGDEGWELAGHVLAQGTTWNTWWFKRPLVEEVR